MMDYGNFSTPLSTCGHTGKWKGCWVTCLPGCPQFSHVYGKGIENRSDDL